MTIRESKPDRKPVHFAVIHRMKTQNSYMPDAIEYVSEEKAAKISRNPDWQCSFCGSLNSDDLNICKNCGATKEDSERNYFEIRKQEEEKKRKKEEKKETHQKNTVKSAPKKKEKRRNH